ncbi:MAG: YaiI/YqxD family protein [Pseudomonadota bacterium]
MTCLYVDADACPVKDEIIKVALRHRVETVFVSCQGIRLPADPLLKSQMVPEAFDAADDWIAERAGDGDVVITADIPLADRCLKAGASVLGPNGKPFTEDMIGGALAARAIMADLRAGGDQVGGPAPFSKQDRSRFLQALDGALAGR